MATRTRSKAGKGQESSISPAQYQTLLSYSTLKQRNKLSDKKKDVGRNPEEKVETYGDFSVVKIKHETIERS